MQLSEQIGFKVEPELRNKIAKVAADEKRTVACLMRFIAAKYVDFVEHGQAPARQ